MVVTKKLTVECGLRHDELADIVGHLLQRAAGEKGTGARVVVLFTRNDDVKALLRYSLLVVDN